jgi:hypothetical protein
MPAVGGYLFDQMVMVTTQRNALARIVAAAVAQLAHVLSFE